MDYETASNSSGGKQRVVAVAKMRSAFVTEFIEIGTYKNGNKKTKAVRHYAAGGRITFAESRRCAYPELVGAIIPERQKRERKQDDADGLLPGCEEAYQTTKKVKAKSVYA